MAINLDKIKVEPVYDYFERADVSSVLSRCHPLGDRKAIGARIAYAASYRGEWLGVLLFDQPADRNKHREARIGWNSTQVVERRKHIANNSRFALLPKYQGVANLASKILSLVCARISEDWRKQYGVALLAVETYVDPSHNDNQGTCYTAAGWEQLGLSSGYLKTDGERTHGKWYFLKALHADSYRALSSDIPHALLTGVKDVSGKSNNNYVLDAAKIDLKGLQKVLSQIKDPRRRQARKYELVPLLSLCICAVVSGYTQYRQIADWISKLPLKERVRFGLPADHLPHETTISNFLSGIDSEQLRAVLTNWLLTTFNSKKIKTISLDGKAIRASSSQTHEQHGFLNVFAHELGIVINQIPTAKGGAEKIAARKILKNDQLLDNKIILADAIHTDAEFVKTIVKKTPNTYSLLRIIKNL